MCASVGAHFRVETRARHHLATGGRRTSTSCRTAPALVTPAAAESIPKPRAFVVTRCRLRTSLRPRVGLPDLPYFTGDPVFQPRSHASRKEAARETESPVFDYRLIQIGRMTTFDYLYILILIMIHRFGFQM